MATTVNATSVAAMIKELFPQKRIDRLWQLRYPLLSEIRKSDRFEGSSIRIPVEHDHPAVSGSFAKAQANYYPTTSKVFDLTRVPLYGFSRIDAETMRSTRSDLGGFLRVLDREISNLLLAMQKRVALGLYRDAGGALASVASVATNVITLNNKSDVVNFSVGATVIGNTASDGSGTARTAKAITAIDFDAGTITLEASHGLVGADYLFIEGDDQSTYNGFISGLEAWVPATAPGGSDSHFGVNRSDDVARLAGHRISDTSLSAEEAIQEAAYRCMYTGGMPDRCFANPIQVKQLALELDTKVERDPGGTGRVGFRGINVETAAGTISVIADPACPEDAMFLGEVASLELIHLDPLPHIVEDDSLRMLRVSDADQVEVRARGWMNMACTKPGAWCRIARPTVF